MSRKVKVHDYWSPPTYRNSRGTGMTGRMMFNIRRRQGERAKYAFEACVHVLAKGSSAPARGRGRMAADQYECASAAAPRRALGAAMKKLASTLVKRSSAFRGAR